MTTDTAAPTATDTPELRITRTLNAPQERVFAAWTDPAQLARWWGPKSFTLPAMEADIRPGGQWRACIRSPEGQDHWMGGTYKEIDPPERLVFSFAWEEPDALDTLITVTLKADGARTRLTFHQTPFRTTESRDSHMGGWTSCLERLDDFLASA